MSSAPARILAPAGRILRGLLWTALFAVLAASGAGLVSVAWHPPGTPARAELTYVGDAALGARLDAVTTVLQEVAGEVDVLADAAKTALAEVTNNDPTRLRESLVLGGQAATTIERRARELRQALAGLPGDGPAAEVQFSNAMLARRAAVITAVEAASGLAVHWQAVAARATETANLTAMIDRHDRTVLAGAAEGVAGDWPRAIATLDEALLLIADIQTLRARLIAGSEGTVLDEWIRRSRNYDRALRNVYRALRDSGGIVTVEVQFARREERQAFAQLPPDRRSIIVIVSEVTRGSLTDAVLAIDAAEGSIEEALPDEAAPGPSPSPARSPAGSPEGT